MISFRIAAGIVGRTVRRATFTFTFARGTIHPDGWLSRRRGPSGCRNKRCRAGPPESKFERRPSVDSSASPYPPPALVIATTSPPLDSIYEVHGHLVERQLTRLR